jgi:hypothetical protein
VLGFLSAAVCPSAAQKVREFTGSPSLRCSALANCRGTTPWFPLHFHSAGPFGDAAGSHAVGSQPQQISLTSHYGFSTSCIMATCRTHRMARVLMWLALLFAGVAVATTVQASPSDLGDPPTIAGELRQVPTVSVYAAHDQAATHQHGEHAPCRHGMCGQCCPSCSTGVVGFSLPIDYCLTIEPVAASQRYSVASAELPHAWLSQLPFRPPI